MKAIHTTVHYNKLTGQTKTQTGDIPVLDESSITQQKEQNVVGLYPGYTYQTFGGYGCAMTESACFLLSKMTPGARKEALSMLRERYPDKVFMHSESCGLHIPGKTTAFEIPADELEKLPASHPLRGALQKSPLQVDFDDAVNYAHDIMGDLNHGMERWIDWNLIVDRTGGPRHVPGGFTAPLVYEEDGSFTRTVSYEFLQLIARTLRPGSVRIGCSAFGRDVDAAAVRNEDGSLGVVLLNHAGGGYHRQPACRGQARGGRASERWPDGYSHSVSA